MIIRVLAALAAAMITLLAAVPARATARAMSLSLDGRSWGPTIERPLFSATRFWVPGDAEHVDFFVRNDASASADLRLDLVSEPQDPRLGNGLVLRTEIKGRPITPAGGRLVTVDGLVRMARIQVIVMFAGTAGNDTQRKSTPIRLRVTLTEQLVSASMTPTSPAPSSPAPSSPAPSSRAPGPLAGRGGPSPLVLLLGLGLLLVGSLLAIAGSAALRKEDVRGGS
jgi:hypothetical protein